MLLVVLGILDLVIGALLVISPGGGLAGSGIVFIFAVIAIIKGIYSVLAGAGAGFYFDFLGWLDLFAGFLLLLAQWGTVFGFFLYAGILMVAKALYSIFAGLVGSQE
jgi:hypothetical protein